MQCLPKDTILEFNPNTLQEVRKIHGFQNAQDVNEAIDLLNDWVQKQNHFLKRDFSREYLERLIINCKGSVERAKARLDKLCTFKTLLPQYFGDYNPRKQLTHLGVMTLSTLPKMTKDNDRVLLVRYIGKIYNSRLYLDGYRFSTMMYEYLRAHDYANNNIILIDLFNVNLAKAIPELDITELHQINSVLMEGYGARLKGIHILSTSKLIDAFVSIIKQIVSTKIGGRIHVHKTIEEIYDVIPKAVLPKEYGGEERFIDIIDDEWIDVLGSKEFREYRKEMNKARTNEECRQTDTFNKQYMGMPGTFRTLSVD